MYCYFFILGQNKNLSIAELLNKPDIKGADLDMERIEVTDKILIIRTKKVLNSVELIKFLGGTIKIGEITDEFRDVGEIKANDIIPLIKNIGGKVRFGFSLENISGKKFIKSLAIAIKKHFKAEKINSRWIEAKEGALSSVAVEKNDMLKKGAEVYIIRSRDKIYLGRTLVVQDFESYGKRDYGRPSRDIISGIIPPKLAQIMINLAGIDNNEFFLDPFCGSGTFLQEALLMDYKKIIGSDISEKAIEDSRDNLEWLKQNYQLSTINYQLINVDVREISKNIKAESIGGIATEPYLGPTSQVLSHKFQIPKLMNELSNLYLGSFREFKKILKKGGKVVIIFPAINEGGSLKYLNILDDIKKIGFEIIDFIPKDFKGLAQKTPRGSLLYARPTPNQRVAREIFIFRKK